MHTYTHMYVHTYVRTHIRTYLLCSVVSSVEGVQVVSGDDAHVRTYLNSTSNRRSDSYVIEFDDDSKLVN